MRPAARLLAALLGASALIGALGSFAVVRIHELSVTSDIVRQTEIEAYFLLSTFERAASYVEQSIDDTLTYLPPLDDERSIDEYLDNRNISFPIVLLSWIGADGLLVASSQDFIAPVDLSDRVHFRVHKDGIVPADVMYVGPPVVGRVSQKYTLEFTKALRDEQGGLLGVLVASYDAEDFIQFYTDYMSEPNQLVSLVGFDGIVRTRSVMNNTNSFGAEVPDRVLHEAILASNGQRLRFTSGFDGVDRVGYAAVSDRFPVYLVAARSSAAAGSSVAPYLVAWWCILVVILAVGVALANRRQRRELARMGSDLRARLETSEKLAVVSRLSALGQLAAGIAHEVSTPANTILLAVRNMRTALDRNQLPSEKLQDKLFTIDASATRVRVLMEAVRSAGRPAQSIDACDPNNAVAESLLLLKQLIENDHIRVSHVHCKGTILVPYAHSEMVTVMVNLVLNARDTIREKKVADGYIDIHCRVSHEILTVTVSDNGGGIPADILSRVFDPFFSTKPASMGAGIGLYFVHQLIVSRGGEVKATNGPDGAIFILELPLVPVESE